MAKIEFIDGEPPVIRVSGDCGDENDKRFASIRLIKQIPAGSFHDTLFVLERSLAFGDRFFPRITSETVPNELAKIYPAPISDEILEELPVSTCIWRDSENEWGAAVNLGEDGCRVAKGTSASDAALGLWFKLRNSDNATIHN